MKMMSGILVVGVVLTLVFPVAAGLEGGEATAAKKPPLQKSGPARNSSTRLSSTSITQRADSVPFHSFSQF